MASAVEAAAAQRPPAADDLLGRHPPTLALEADVRARAAAQAAFDDYLHALDLVDARIVSLERQIGPLAADPAFVPLVGRLRCLRGVDTRTAPGLLAEIGDFSRFETAEEFISYQQRLYRRWRRMAAHGKPNQKIVVACSRELAGFVWAIGSNQPLRAEG